MIILIIISCLKREKTLLMKISFKDKEIEEYEREIRDLEHDVKAVQGIKRDEY
jgi:hypothetical protein